MSDQRSSGVMRMSSNSVSTRTPEETEFERMRITPEERWPDIKGYLVRHGQGVCLPNRPRCGSCVVKDLCRRGTEAGRDRRGHPNYS